MRGLTQIHLATQYGHHFVDEHLMQFKSESPRLLSCNWDAEAHSGELSSRWTAPRSVNHWTKCALDYRGKLQFSCAGESSTLKKMCKKKKKGGQTDPTASGNRQTSHTRILHHWKWQRGRTCLVFRVKSLILHLHVPERWHLRVPPSRASSPINDRLTRIQKFTHNVSFILYYAAQQKMVLKGDTTKMLPETPAIGLNWLITTIFHRLQLQYRATIGCNECRTQHRSITASGYISVRQKSSLRCAGWLKEGSNL